MWFLVPGGRRGLGYSPPRPGRVGKARVGARKDGTAHEDPSLSNSPLFFAETDFGLA